MIGNRPNGSVLDPGFIMQVIAGLVPGWSHVRKFGSIDAIQAAVKADVWEYGITVGAERYTFSADGVNDIDTISSSDVGDSQSMSIDGLTADGVRVLQFKALDGQNKVTLDTSLNRVNRVFNDNATDLLGNVYCYVDGAITTGVPNVVTTVRGYVSIGEGQTLQGIYTPHGNTRVYFLGYEASLTKGTGATAVDGNFRIRTKALGKVLRTQDEFNLLSTGTSSKDHNFPAPIPFDGQTDFVPVVDVSASGVGASWAYTVLIEEL